MRYLESRLKGGQLSIVSELLIDSVPEIVPSAVCVSQYYNPQAAQTGKRLRLELIGLGVRFT